MAASLGSSGFAFNAFTSQPVAESSVDIGPWSNVDAYAVPR